MNALVYLPAEWEARDATDLRTADVVLILHPESGHYEVVKNAMGMRPKLPLTPQQARELLSSMEAGT